MITQLQLEYQGKKYFFNPQQSLDISLPLKNGKENVNCYFAEDVVFQTIRSDSFIGSVAEGGSVNYQKITFTPHGNGTHTECFGHISTDKTATISNCLKSSFFLAELVSIEPQSVGEDKVVFWEDLVSKIQYPAVEAFIIRTLPNDARKKIKQYSNSNPPYLNEKIGTKLAELGIKHLLVDLPSVDREIDGGLLKMHKAFWQFPNNIRADCTITELIFVEDTIQDGLYLLNLQTVNFDIDASPSRPILFKLIEINDKID